MQALERGTAPLIYLFVGAQIRVRTPKILGWILCIIYNAKIDFLERYIDYWRVLAKKMILNLTAQKRVSIGFSDLVVRKSNTHLLH